MQDPTESSGKVPLPRAFAGSPLSSLAQQGMLPVSLSLPRVSSETYSSLLEAIVRSTDDAIITKNLSSIVTSWNPAATKIFGWESHEIIGHSLLRLIPPRLHHEEMEVTRRLRAGERISNRETLRMTRDGREIEIAMTISPLSNSRGEVIGATTIARNITEQRATERARLRLAAIVESSVDAIIACDLSGTVTSWNPAAERLLGYRADEMLGEQVQALVPEDCRELELSSMDTLFNGQQIEPFETHRLHREGHAVEVSVTVSPLLDAAGHVVGASQFLRDISRRKALELSLVQAGELASTARVASDLAHHVNNPLESLTNLIYLAQKSAADASQVRVLLEHAVRELDRVAQMTQQTLSANRRSAEDAESNFTRLSETLSAG